MAATRLDRVPAVLIAVLLAASGVTANAAPDRAGDGAAPPTVAPPARPRRVVYPRIDDRVFDDLCASLGRNDLALREAYERYLTEIAQLDADTFDRMRAAGLDEADALEAELDPLHAAGPPPTSRREWEERRRLSEERRDDPRWTELRAMHARVRAVQVEGMRGADPLALAFADELRTALALSDAQHAALVRFIWREVVEPPRRDVRDLMHPVDVIGLLDQFIADDDALAARLTPRTLATAGSRERDLDAAIEPILQTYAARLHDHLRARAEATWRNPNQPMRIESGTEEWRVYRRDNARRWQERYDISRDAARAVQEVLIRADLRDQADEWRRRYLAALAPAATSSDWTQMAWYEGRFDVTPEQVAAARAVADRHAAARRPLVDDAIERGIRYEGHTDLDGSRELHESYVRAVVELHEATRRYFRELAQVMTTDQSEALLRLLDDRAARDRDGVLGPPIIGPVLKRYDLYDAYWRPVTLDDADDAAPSGAASDSDDPGGT